MGLLCPAGTIWEGLFERTGARLWNQWAPAGHVTFDPQRFCLCFVLFHDLRSPVLTGCWSYRGGPLQSQSPTDWILFGADCCSIQRAPVLVSEGRCNPAGSGTPGLDPRLWNVDPETEARSWGWRRPSSSAGAQTADVLLRVFQRNGIFAAPRRQSGLSWNILSEGCSWGTGRWRLAVAGEACSASEPPGWSWTSSAEAMSWQERGTHMCAGCAANCCWALRHPQVSWGLGWTMRRHWWRGQSSLESALMVSRSSYQCLSGFLRS